MYYTYILKSLKTPGAVYIGSTADIKRRLLEHNKGESIYTNKHRPWKIESFFAFPNTEMAENFEKYLKSNSGKAFMSKRLTSQDFNQQRNLYKNGRKPLLQ